MVTDDTRSGDRACFCRDQKSNRLQHSDVPRDNVADLLLQAREVQEQLIADSKVLLISGTALAQSPSREAVFQALTYCKEAWNRHCI